MCTLSRLVKPAASLLFMLGMMTLAASSPSAAQDVCPGFDRKHTITRLGGPNALAPGGGHSRTRAELQAYFAANAETIRAVLASRGIGEEVANALLDAVRQGTGITERAMPEGERLQWMAYRKNGRVATIENVCLNLPGAAPAFEITVPVVTAAETARADCSIDVTTDHQPGGTSTFRVRTAPGARVTMEGPAGSRTIIEGGASTWTGPWDDPYRADYAFTVTNERSDHRDDHQLHVSRAEGVPEPGAHRPDRGAACRQTGDLHRAPHRAATRAARATCAARATRAAPAICRSGRRRLDPAAVRRIPHRRRGDERNRESGELPVPGPHDLRL